jgi:hypothetical protein
VVELWAEQGQMLLGAARALRANRALALVTPGSAVPDALHTAPDVEVRTMPADPAELPTADGDEGFDVTLGAVPWRWAPAPTRLRAPGGRSVELCDDPANVAMLQACTTMPEHGIGLFVLGLGTLARRGPASVAANLPRFGVHVWNVVPLPPRMFVPASRPGRVLLALHRRPAPSARRGQRHAPAQAS